MFAPLPFDPVGGLHLALGLVNDIRKIWKWTDSNDAADKTAKDFGDLPFEPIP